jgi:hypothetical protein
MTLPTPELGVLEMCKTGRKPKVADEVVEQDVRSAHRQVVLDVEHPGDAWY